MNALTNPLERTATTDIRDLAINILVGRIGGVGEQRSRRHDHAWLTVTALGRVELSPCLLHGMIVFARQAFDGGELWHRQG